MEYKKMREYTHEEFVNLIMNLTEEQLLELSSQYGGYPVLFRMALDERINHIPFIQTEDVKYCSYCPFNSICMKN